MGKKNIGGAVLDDLKALPKKILKPYYKNGKLNANKVAIDGIPFVIIFYVINKYVQAVVSADGGDMLDKCVKAFSLIFQANHILHLHLSLHRLSVVSEQVWHSSFS